MGEWKLTLTKKQLILINNALEFYFRFMMGQEMYVANEYCLDALGGYGVDEFCERREKAEQALRVCFRSVFPKGYCEKKSDASVDMADMWSAIRHALWEARPEPKSHDTVDAYRPYHEGDLPPIKVERMGRKNESV